MAKAQWKKECTLWPCEECCRDCLRKERCAKYQQSKRVPRWWRKGD